MQTSELYGQLLLQSALEPYLRFLTGWVFRGECQDPYGEFVEATGEVATPSFLQSARAAVNRSGRLLGSLASRPPQGAAAAPPRAGGEGQASTDLAAFFDLPHGSGAGFQPVDAAGARDEEYFGSARLALRCSARAAAAAAAGAGAGAGGPAPARAGRQPPVAAEPPAPNPAAAQASASLLDRPLSASGLREAEAAAALRRSFREGLDAQMEEKKARGAADAEAKRREEPDRPLLERLAAPARVEAARERLLAEHAAEAQALEAQAAFLEWRLERMRLDERRRRFLLQDMEALHADMQSRGGVPAAAGGAWGPVQNPWSATEGSAWGPAVNPFEDASSAAPASSSARTTGEPAELGPAQDAPRPVPAEHRPQQQAAGLPGLRPEGFRLTWGHVFPAAEVHTFGPATSDAARGIARAVLRAAYAAAADAERRRGEEPELRAASVLQVFTPSPTAAPVGAGQIYVVESTDDVSPGRSLLEPHAEAEVAVETGEASEPEEKEEEVMEEEEEEHAGAQPIKVEGVETLKKSARAKDGGREDEAVDVGCAQDIRWAAESGATPLEACLERCVLRPLLEQASTVDASVVSHFLEDLQLVRRLRILKRYVLMNESRLVEPFVIEALDRFAASEREALVLGGLEGALNVLFQATVPRPPDAEDDAFLSCIHFATLPPVDSAPARRGAWPLLESLRLGLSVGPPLSRAFPDHVLSRYSDWFRLLALVHYALHSSKRAWLLLSRSAAAAARHGPWEDPPVPASVAALRHQMHHFVATLQRYLLVDVMAAEFAKLEARLASARCFEGLLAAHSRFAELCGRKAFLDHSDRGLLNTVVSMLGQVLRLGRALEAALGSGDEPEPGPLSSRAHRALQTIEVTFYDLRWQLKLSLPDQSTVRFAGESDFLEAWLETWLRRCEE